MIEKHTSLFQAYRPLLFSLAYRMVSSAVEAEDIVQEAYLRFREVALDEVESPRAYLCTVVTRLCLNFLSSARVKRESYIGPWLPEPILTGYSGQAAGPESQLGDQDSISMAFLLLLENLTPAERAVFLLHEVFDYEYKEVAGILGKSETACRKLYSRAKAYLVARRPRYQSTAEEHQRLLEEFMRAAGGGDLAGLTALLAEDVTFWADGGGKARGAALHPVQGQAAVARFVLGVTARFMPPGAMTEVADVNGRPALLIRQQDGTPAIVISVDVGGGRIQHLWVVANPDKLGHVGMGELPGDGRRERDRTI